MRSINRMVATALAAGMATAPTLAANRLYACGDDQVREYRIDGTGTVESWRWTAAAATDLPPAYRATLLAHIDDCKPVEDGRAILVTASTGGVVLIDRATGRVRFRAIAPMAHSADLLPGGRIAVALSLHAEGNRLILYDRRRSETPLLDVPLPSGHGAVWDPVRSRLFALSHDLVQAFAVGGSRARPTLTETARWPLPGRRDGHDLSPRPDGRYLVTTEDGVWTFDPDPGRFVPLPALYPARQVKAVAAAGGRLAWVQAETRWWANGFTVADADGGTPRRVPVADLHLYKVRWLR